MNIAMSVVMPAHDEETIIGRSLRSLVASDADCRLEIVVVANGCSDQTAAVAAAVSPRIRVVQISAASKIAALNAGDDAAVAFPRAYVDADVDVHTDALLAVAERLDAARGVFVGAPVLQIDTTRASLPVRQYYRVWEQSEYRAPGHVGSGVYVLSQAGRARFGRFPDVIADDRFVQKLFAQDERVTVSEYSFTVPAPRTFRALLDRATRIASGNHQLESQHPEPQHPASQHPVSQHPVSQHPESQHPGAAGSNGSPRFSALIKRVAVRPSLWLAFGTYCYGYLVPRVRARRLQAAGRTPGWNRDDTTRVSA